MSHFYISISNGLLKDGHRKRMGAAVWEYMWMIDKITRIDDDGTGWVLGGKPIKIQRIADDLDTHHHTVSLNLGMLESEGYITKQRTSCGLVLKVTKAKKRFNKNVESRSVDKPVDKARGDSMKTLNRRGGDSTKTLNRHDENVESHIRCLTIAVDNTSLSQGERENVIKELKRLVPQIISLPDSVPIERAYLFLHRIRTGEIKTENLYSPTAYLLKMQDEDITGLIAKEREIRARQGGAR